MPGERVTLLDAVGVRNVFVAAGKRNRLKGDGLHLVDILGGKFNDAADAVVVPRIDDRRHKRDLDADGGEVFDRLELYVEQVADAAMLVVFFVRAVKLQINAVLAGLFRGFAKLDILGVANAVGRGENAIKTDLLRVGDRVEKIRRQASARRPRTRMMIWRLGLNETARSRIAFVSSNVGS